MDPKKLGKISFKEFLVWLSVMCHGTIGDKIAWIFRLYDTNEDELIDREDLFSIMKSIYLLMGKRRDADDDALMRQKADQFFEVSHFMMHTGRKRPPFVLTFAAYLSLLCVPAVRSVSIASKVAAFRVRNSGMPVSRINRSSSPSNTSTPSSNPTSSLSSGKVCSRCPANDFIKVSLKHV